MKKVLIGGTLCVFLTGCEPTHYEDAGSSYKLPPTRTQGDVGTLTGNFSESLSLSF